MKILITSSHGKKNLVKAFENAGAEVVSRLEDGIRLIVPTVDEELPFFADSREWFKSKGIEVMVGSEFTVSTCRDKIEFYKFCRRHGFNVLPTMQDTLIAKPRFGKGSKGLIHIDTSYIVQPEIDDPEISIDYFSSLTGEFISAIPRFRVNVVNGESQAAKIVNVFDLSEVLRMGKELNLVGHNVIQGFYKDIKTFIFSEVNTRYGGGSHLTFNKFNSPKWLIDNLSNVPVSEMWQTSSKDKDSKERQD